MNPNDPSLPSFQGYTLLSLLGQGGMGCVFRARQESLKREVALKVLLGGLQGIEVADTRFKREIRINLELDHPSLVKVYDAGISSDLCYLAMELVSGGTLQELLRARPKDCRDAFLKVSTSAVQGIQYLHQQNILHRDIKPANILMSGDGRILISDLGLASDPRRTNITAPQSMIGTLQYMAPEVLGQKPHGLPSDIYALGIVFYEIIQGHRPYRGKTIPELVEAVLEGQAMPITNDSVSDELGDLIMAMIRRDPAQRPLIQEVASCIERVGDLMEVEARQLNSSVTQPAESGSGRHPIGGTTPKHSNPGRTRSGRIVSASSPMETRAPDGSESSPGKPNRGKSNHGHSRRLASGAQAAIPGTTESARSTIWMSGFGFILLTGVLGVVFVRGMVSAPTLPGTPAARYQLTISREGLKACVGAPGKTTTGSLHRRLRWSLANGPGVEESGVGSSGENYVRFISPDGVDPAQAGSLLMIELENGAWSTLKIPAIKPGRDAHEVISPGIGVVSDPLTSWIARLEGSATRGDHLILACNGSVSIPLREELPESWWVYHLISVESSGKLDDGSEVSVRIEVDRTYVDRMPAPPPPHGPEPGQFPQTRDQPAVPLSRGWDFWPSLTQGRSDMERLVEVAGWLSRFLGDERVPHAERLRLYSALASQAFQEGKVLHGNDYNLPVEFGPSVLDLLDHYMPVKIQIMDSFEMDPRFELRAFTLLPVDNSSAGLFISTAYRGSVGQKALLLPDRPDRPAWLQRIMVEETWGLSGTVKILEGDKFASHPGGGNTHATLELVVWNLWPDPLLMLDLEGKIAPIRIPLLNRAGRGNMTTSAHGTFRYPEDRFSWLNLPDVCLRLNCKIPRELLHDNLPRTANLRIISGMMTLETIARASMVYDARWVSPELTADSGG